MFPMYSYMDVITYPFPNPNVGPWTPTRVEWKYSVFIVVLYIYIYVNINDPSETGQLCTTNSLAVTGLLSEGGLIDELMTMGVKGAYEIIRRYMKDWKFGTQGSVDEDLIIRGVGTRIETECISR